MRITTKTPEFITDRDIDQLSHLAGIGFGQGDSEEMRKDSEEHIHAADIVQMAYDDEQLVAFSMVRGCLWRQSV